MFRDLCFCLLLFKYLSLFLFRIKLPKVYSVGTGAKNPFGNKLEFDVNRNILFLPSFLPEIIKHLAYSLDALLSFLYC